MPCDYHIYIYIYIYIYVQVSIVCFLFMDMFKKILFLAKAWHWCLHLHLDCSKCDFSSWVIPFIPMVKLKDCSFQIWRSYWKQTKHSGDLAIFFTVTFMILSGMQVHTSRMLLFYILFELEKIWTWFFVTW